MDRKTDKHKQGCETWSNIGMAAPRGTGSGGWLAQSWTLKD